MIEPTNETRASWALTACEAFAGETGQDLETDGLQEVMSNLLCDLMHLADDERFSFAQLLATAQMHYEEEKASRMNRGNWTDNECWYCSVVDGPRKALLLGPFETEEACRRYAYRDPAAGGDPEKHRVMRLEAAGWDPWSHFYSFGMVKMPNGHREGILNACIEYEQRVTMAPAT